MNKNKKWTQKEIKEIEETTKDKTLQETKNHIAGLDNEQFKNLYGYVVNEYLQRMR